MGLHNMMDAVNLNRMRLQAENNIKYCNVDGQSVAKQRLGKQTSTTERLSYAVRAEEKHGDIGSLFPGNAAVNINPQEWETVFSVGSVQRNYLKNKWRYCSVLTSEFSVEDSHGESSTCEDLKCD
jgi:hypothetical protein